MALVETPHPDPLPPNHPNYEQSYYFSTHHHGARCAFLGGEQQEIFGTSSPAICSKTGHTCSYIVDILAGKQIEANGGVYNNLKPFQGCRRVAHT